MSAVAALAIFDDICRSASHADVLLKDVDAKLLLTREQFENASAEQRGSKNENSAGALHLAKLLLSQFDALAAIEDQLDNGTHLACSEVYDMLNTLVSQQQFAALNLQLFLRLRKAVHLCNTQISQAAVSWSSSHEDEICKLLPGAFERLCALGSLQSSDQGLEVLLPLTRHFTTALNLRVAEGLISALLTSLGHVETIEIVHEVGPLASLLSRWLALLGNSGESLRDVTALWLALLSGGSETQIICKRWKSLGDNMLAHLVSNKQYAQLSGPLKEYVDMLDTQSALPIWIVSLPKSSRSTLSEKLSLNLELNLQSEVESPSTPLNMLLEKATNELCSALYDLFGPCGVLWPLAPQVPGVDVDQENVVYDVLLYRPDVYAVLRGPCTSLFAALEKMPLSVVGERWLTMRSAVAPHSSCGQGLLPADLLAVLFVCHVICMKGPVDASADAKLVMASSVVSKVSAALLKVALRDVPFAQTDSLKSGFEAFLGLSWPPRSAFELISGFRSPPSRFPGIIGAWTRARSRKEAEQAGAWSLQDFVAALDDLEGL